MTGSEWILTRFGSDKAGKASHIIVAIFAIISTIGFIAYFFEGIGNKLKGVKCFNNSDATQVFVH